MAIATQTSAHPDIASRAAESGVQSSPGDSRRQDRSRLAPDVFKGNPPSEIDV